MRSMAVAICLASSLAFSGGVVVKSFGSPEATVTGLAFAQGNLFAVSQSGTVYRLNPSNGSVLGSFSVIPNSNGMCFAGNLIYITNGTSSVYKYGTGGESHGVSLLYCAS